MGNVNWTSEASNSALQRQNVVTEAQQKKNAARQRALRNFYSCELSPDQERVVEELWQFFSSEHQVFLLKGYAGTGKTFLLGGIVRYLNALEWMSCCCAPTGKAAQVLRDKLDVAALTIHKTIYRFNQTSDVLEQEGDGAAPDSEEDDTIVVGSIKDAPSSCLVLLVDESSMVSDAVTDDDKIICGSGKLLSDIFTFLQLEKYPGRKVIFIGDAAQLPPVGSKISPALSAQYLKEHFGYAVVEDELRSIVRQQEQSTILQNSLKLRQGLQNNFYQELTFTLKPGEVDTAASHESLVQDLAQRYKEELAQQRMPQVSMVCHSNQLALGYNLHIRHCLFNLPYYASNSGLHGVYAGSYDQMTVEHPLDLQVGDLLLVLRNNYLEELFNGQLVVLGQFDPKALVSRTIHLRQSKAELRRMGLSESGTNWIEVTLKFLPVELWCSAPDNQWVIKKVLLLTNALYSPERSISHDEQRALYVDFRMRHRELKHRSEEFRSALLADPYYNAVQVHFGYALTCHKAQGSEWQHVFVDCNGSTGANEQNFRWLYTAITRAKSQLTLINYRERKVASKLKIASSFKLDESTLPSSTSDTTPSTAVTPQAPSLNILREPDGEQPVPNLGDQAEPDWNQRASSVVARINSSLAERHEPNWDQPEPSVAEPPESHWDQSVPPFAEHYDPSWEPPVPPFAEPPEPSWEPPVPPFAEPPEPSWEPPVPPFAEPTEPHWDRPAPPFAQPREPRWEQSVPPFAEPTEPHWDRPAPPFAQPREPRWEQSVPPFGQPREPSWEPSAARLHAQPDPSLRSNVAPAEPYFDRGDAAAAPINRGEEAAQSQRNVDCAPVAQRSDPASSPAEQLVSFCAEQCRQLSYAHLQVSHLASPDYQEQLSISDEREGKSMVVQVYYGGNDCYSKVRVSKSNLDQQLSSNLVNALQSALKGRSRLNLMGGNSAAVEAVAPPDMGNVGFNDYLQRLQAYLAQNKILTLSWQQLQYVLRVKFYATADIAPKIHSGDSVEINLGYNGKFAITYISPSRKGEGDKPLGRLVISLIESF